MIRSHDWMTFDGRMLSGVGVLAAVVEAGSFVRAGETLGITQSGVSRGIARLEAQVGVRLLDRTTRSLALTAEGRRLYEQIGPLLAEIGDAVTVASGAAAVARGVLRVNADSYFSALMFAPQAGQFLKKHSEVSVELITRPEVGDLVADGFDVAVRFGEPAVSSLVARKLMEPRVLTVASPDYLERCGKPRSPEEIRDHECVQFRDPATGRPFIWELHRGRHVVQTQGRRRLLVNDVATLIGACLAGVGIAQVLAPSVAGHLQEGRLVEIFPDWPDERFPLYALYPSRRLPPAKLRAFLDFVVELAT
jgi:DNA-binding transcriptional LysR family regulator